MISIWYHLLYVSFPKAVLLISLLIEQWMKANTYFNSLQYLVVRWPPAPQHYLKFLLPTWQMLSPAPPLSGFLSDIAELSPPHPLSAEASAVLASPRCSGGSSRSGTTWASRGTGWSGWPGRSRRVSWSTWYRRDRHSPCSKYRHKSDITNGYYFLPSFAITQHQPFCSRLLELANERETSPAFYPLAGESALACSIFSR